jgi:hypothetical protein
LRLNTPYAAGTQLFSDWKPLPLLEIFNNDFPCKDTSDRFKDFFTRDTSGYLCVIKRDRSGTPLPGAPAPVGSCPVTAGPYPVAVAENGDGRLAVFFICAGGSNVFFSSQGKKGCGIDWQNPLPLTNLSDQDF